MKFLIPLLIIVVCVVIAALRLRRVISDKSLPDASSAKPPGTRDLDEETAVRPEIDMASLAAVRSKVSEEIPDEILQDVLLDATPQQAARMFSGISQDVMRGAIGEQAQGVQFKGQFKTEDLNQLQNLSNSIDDLDIWSFGDDNESKNP